MMFNSSGDFFSQNSTGSANALEGTNNGATIGSKENSVTRGEEDGQSGGSEEFVRNGSQCSENDGYVQPVEYGLAHSDLQDDNNPSECDDNDEELRAHAHFDTAANFYQRQKYPTKKRPSDGEFTFDKTAVSKRDDDSPGRKKVRAAVYRNATGSAYHLNAVYGKMKGSLKSSGMCLSAYRPVMDSGGQEYEDENLADNEISSDGADTETTNVQDETSGDKRKPSKMASGRKRSRRGLPQLLMHTIPPSGNNDEASRLMDIVEMEILDSKAMCVKWDDVAGLAPVKKTIQEIVVWPMLRPELFTGLRSPPKGLLLFGPPGTGKTTLGRCIASQAKATFYCISASSLTSKWVGENEKLVRALFESARAHQPAVVFVDEVDALLSNRLEGEHDSTRRLKTQFLTELDGAKTSADDRILVVGATNRPGDLDDAARRRFTKRLYVPLPDCPGRIDMLENLLKRESHSLTPESLQVIAEKTEGFSCDDLKKMCQEAALGPIRRLGDITSVLSEELSPISIEDFDNALCVVRPSVAKEQLAQYEEFDRRYGSAGAITG